MSHGGAQPSRKTSMPLPFPSVTTHSCRGATTATSIFDFKVKDAAGGEVDLADYRDKKKAFLVVNVASQ